MAKRKKDDDPAIPDLPADVQALCDMFMRTSDRLGLLSLMLRHVVHSRASGAFREFLSSPDGLNEPVDEEGAAEEFAPYYMEMLSHTVVMLHATVEDTVRTVARVRLPLAKPEVLKEIPILRPEPAADKLKELGQLAPHRGMTVDDLIRQSVDIWLDRHTFNSAQQVSSMLEASGIDVAPVRPRLAAIDFIARLRHQIAHTGEMDERGVQSFVDGPEIQHYIQEVYHFVRTVCFAVIPKEHANQIIVRVVIQQDLNRRRGLPDPDPRWVDSLG